MEYQYVSQFEEAYFVAYEEEWCGYAIYIERNPDRFRGGFEWLVCFDNEVIQSGLAFHFDFALAEAQQFINSRAKED
ncbi:hypothetical protein [Shewanella xiamenensis]|uniref:hypothetical protein n=1 Tax=Shewanella xiamenensis TaxID=332186 RepID=UPI000DB525B4|nr:hypothetical protein [Shewanella xiamenensis]MCT8864128.1 hypothetical protein [Shewanella xiamenensis]MCT8875946.1 hypothetical protein [Shewanella xiamenensis]PZP36898.1 MAG: hypothetical protein DI594_04315 [Shewanella oneidensis]